MSAGIEILETICPPDMDEKFMIKPEAGEKVSVHYVATLEDGTEFDNSVEREEPLEFIIGANHVMPGMEKAVLDMKRGEHRMVKVAAREAYGEYNPELTERVPLTAFADAERLSVGKFIIIETAEGPLRMKIASIEDGMVTVDYNHELAGKDIILEIELLSIAERVSK